MSRRQEDRTLLSPVKSQQWYSIDNNNNNNINNNDNKLIIALKGAIPDFLQSPHSAADRLQHIRSSGLGVIVCKSRAVDRVQITCNGSCANHVQWIERLSRATCDTCHVV